MFDHLMLSFPRFSLYSFYLCAMFPNLCILFFEVFLFKSVVLFELLKYIINFVNKK